MHQGSVPMTQRQCRSGGGGVPWRQAGSWLPHAVLCRNLINQGAAVNKQGSRQKWVQGRDREESEEKWRDTRDGERVQQNVCRL